MAILSGLNSIYNSGKSLEDWDKASTPDENLIYRDGMSRQIKYINGIANILTNRSDEGGFGPPKIVSSHSSKSVGLPVSCFKFSPYDQVAAYAFIRDNFHDIKVVVVSDSPIYIPYHILYPEWSQEKYNDEKERYRGYPEDEIILEVEGPIRGQKRINRRQELLASGTDEWYSEDWSHGSILRKNDRIYRAEGVHEVYCEGIDDLSLPRNAFRIYEDGMKEFGCSVGSYPRVALILEYIMSSLEKERYKRNCERRERESNARP